VLEEKYDEAVARFIDMPFPDIDSIQDITLNAVPNNWEVVAARLKTRGLL
jgi:hypothetical protein